MELTDLSEKELRKLLRGAVLTSWEDDAVTLSEMGIAAQSPLENARYMAVIEAEYIKSRAELKNLTKDDAGTKPKRPCVAARRSRCKGSKRSAKLSRSHSGCAGCVCGTRRYGGLPNRDAKDAGICGTMLCSDVNEPDSGAAYKQVYRGQRNRVCVNLGAPRGKSKARRAALACRS